MATLKVYDGTQWQVVSGQGSPGQGVPSGGAAGALLAKNTTANLDATWTDAYMRLVTGTLCLGAVPTAPINVCRLRINALPFAEGYPAYGSIQSTASQSNIPAISLHARSDQVNGVLWATDSAGVVRGGFDKTGRPAQFVQMANVVGTTDGFGSVVFSFPEPFLNTPVVVGNEAGGSNLNVSVYYLTTTQVGFNVRYNNGGVVPNNSVRILYIAVENRSL